MAILELQMKTRNSQAEAQTEGRDQVLINREFSGGTASPTLQLPKALKKMGAESIKPKHSISPRNSSF